MTTSERWYVPLFVVLLLVGARAGAQEKKSAVYPTMAPIEQYRIANREAEIALARSAAPPSVSAAAEVLVLGSSGYETAYDYTAPHGGTWLNPTTILTPRFARLNVTFNF